MSDTAEIMEQAARWRETGIGVPQVTAVADVAGARDAYRAEPGGTCRSSPMVACGAAASSPRRSRRAPTSLMLGSPLARAAEAPGRGTNWGMAAPSPVLPRGTRINVGTRARSSDPLRPVESPTARRTSWARSASRWPPSAPAPSARCSRSRSSTRPRSPPRASPGSSGAADPASSSGHCRPRVWVCPVRPAAGQAVRAVDAVGLRRGADPGTPGDSRRRPAIGLPRGHTRRVLAPPARDRPGTPGADSRRGPRSDPAGGDARGRTRAAGPTVGPRRGHARGTPRAATRDRPRPSRSGGRCRRHRRHAAVRAAVLRWSAGRAY